ncbi:MAG TPA: MFS transporter [Tetragenococcus sp.]|nr:MFS transporter [Tetragenococcus sp.]
MESEVVTNKTKWAITAAALLAFLGILVETSLNVTYPTLTKEFNVSLGTMQWATSGYLLMVTIIMSSTAYLIKRFEARNLFLLATTFYLCGTLLCSVAFSFPILMVGRLLQAVSTGLATPIMFHIILSLVPQHKLGLYMGVGSMVTSFAPALGPTYGGFLTSFLSWRAIFLLILPLLIFIIVAGKNNIDLKAAGTDHQGFDWVGLCFLSAIFISLSVAFASAGNYGFNSRNFIFFIVIFIVVFILFAIHLHNSAKKILNFNLLLQPVVGLRWLNFFILQFINIGISFVLPILAQDYLGAATFTAGLILFPGALLGALVAPLAGRLFDRKGAALPLFIANSMMLIGCLLFYFKTWSLSVVSICLIYIFLRVGFNFGFGNTMSDASKQVNIKKRADINSLFNTFQQYAGSFGTSVLSAVISVFQLQEGQTQAYLTAAGSQVDFIILAVLASVGLATVFLSTKAIK